MRRAPPPLAVSVLAACLLAPSARAIERAAQTRASSPLASPAASGSTGLSALMTAPAAAPAAAMPQGWSGYLSATAAAPAAAGSPAGSPAAAALSPGPALFPTVAWTLEGGAQGRVVEALSARDGTFLINGAPAEIETALDFDGGAKRTLRHPHEPGLRVTVFESPTSLAAFDRKQAALERSLPLAAAGAAPRLLEHGEAAVAGKGRVYFLVREHLNAVALGRMSPRRRPGAAVEALLDRLRDAGLALEVPGPDASWLLSHVLIETAGGTARAVVVGAQATPLGGARLAEHDSMLRALLRTALREPRLPAPSSAAIDFPPAGGKPIVRERRFSVAAAPPAPEREPAPSAAQEPAPSAAAASVAGRAGALSAALTSAGLLAIAFFPMQDLHPAAAFGAIVGAGLLPFLDSQFQRARKRGDQAAARRIAPIRKLAILTLAFSLGLGLLEWGGSRPAAPDRSAAARPAAASQPGLGSTTGAYRPRGEPHYRGGGIVIP